MRTFSLQGIRLRRRVRTTIPEPSATPVADLFERDFTAPAPGAKYMGDITCLPTGDGQFLYLATVLDCFSRRAVGWSLAAHMRAELVAVALAINNRPRKILGWKTPAEVFEEQLRSLLQPSVATTG